MKSSWIPRISVLVLPAALAFTGCGTGTALFQKPAPPVAVHLQGDVQGGQQPISGATVQLYAVGTSGYGSAATPLFSIPAGTVNTSGTAVTWVSGNDFTGLSTGNSVTIAGTGYYISAVNSTTSLTLTTSAGSQSAAAYSAPLSTNANGGFKFPATYCPSSNPSALVYMVASGGQPAGAATVVTNDNQALMVALGQCSGLNSLPRVRLNELTTVAAVWALAPFMSGNTGAYLNIGSTSTNSTGIQLAFNAAQQVVDITTGNIGGSSLPSGATLPTNELNTLADILGQCVNSSGGAEGDGSNCGKLFLDAPNTSGTVYPTDTITAALNIAQNPAVNVQALYNLLPTTPVFEPTLATTTGVPNAWAIAIQYTSTNLNAPTAIAADQSGNIWVTNSTATSSNYYVSEFDNLGTAKTHVNVGTDAPTGLAIDLNGNAWITVSGANSLYKIDSSGNLGSAITGNGLTQPTALAIDGAGQIWVVNNGSGANSVSAFTSAGAAVSSYTGGGISSPVAIAINGNANANCSDCH